MTLTPLGTLGDDLSCPHCHSSDVLQSCVLRGSAVYQCDDCGHRWEVDMPNGDKVVETTTIRVTVSTGYGADIHRLTFN